MSFNELISAALIPALIRLSFAICASNNLLYLEELGLESTIEYCTDSLELDNPELWGQKIIISK